MRFDVFFTKVSAEKLPEPLVWKLMRIKPPDSARSFRVVKVSAPVFKKQLAWRRNGCAVWHPFAKSGGKITFPTWQEAALHTLYHMCIPKVEGDMGAVVRFEALAVIIEGSMGKPEGGDCNEL